MRSELNSFQVKILTDQLEHMSPMIRKKTEKESPTSLRTKNIDMAKERVLIAKVQIRVLLDPTEILIKSMFLFMEILWIL